MLRETEKIYCTCPVTLKQKITPLIKTKYLPQIHAPL